MKAKATIYKNDGETSLGFPVKLIISHQKKTRRKTIGYSKLINWDEIKDLPKVSHPDFESLLGTIFDIRKVAATMEFKNITQLELAFDNLLGKKVVSNSLVSDYFDLEISKLRNVGRDGAADEYLYARNQFKSYSPGLTFEEITVDYLQGFKAYKMKSTSNKTVKNYLSVLRALWNKADVDPKTNIPNTTPFKNIFTGLHTKRRRKKNRYLDKKGLLQLENDLDVLSKVERRAVLLGLLQFYLGGANLIDVYYLREDQFFGERVMLTRRKLGRFMEEFDVKVFPRTREIINELSGPKDGYLFPWRKSHTGYKTFRRNHYDDLLSAQNKLNIGLLPINEKLNSNTFRHSFATIAKFEGVDPDIIRELMGHERDDIDTVYKDKFPEKIRDEGHWKIISLV